VAVGGGNSVNNSILWSTDGKTWNDASSGGFGGGGGYGVSYDGIWVASGGGSSANNNILWSTDGKSWNDASSGGFGGGGGYGAGIASNSVLPRTVTPPCFVQGTRILTPTGYKRVEELQTGDNILTADNRIVPIQMYSFTIQKATKDTAPYRIPSGALGNLIPQKDIHVSPRHAVKDRKGRWQIPKYLGTKAIQYGIGESVTYYHVECPNYYRDNLIAEGMEVESYKNRQGAPGVLYMWDNTIGGWERLPPNKMRTVPANPTKWMLYTI
jgi:hypothetical protein